MVEVVAEAGNNQRQTLDVVNVLAHVARLQRVQQHQQQGTLIDRQLHATHDEGKSGKRKVMFGSQSIHIGAQTTRKWFLWKIYIFAYVDNRPTWNTLQFHCIKICMQCSLILELSQETRNYQWKLRRCEFIIISEKFGNRLIEQRSQLTFKTANMNWQTLNACRQLW